MATRIIHPQQESYRGNVNPIGPRACYDEGKRCAETLFFDYYRQHNLRIRVVRIFNTYGPRMHPNDGRVVSNFIVQALKGEPITLYGDGSQTRAFCYVDDLIEGFLRMMAAPDDITGPMNLGNPVETSVAELAGMVIDLTGSRSKIVHRPLPIDDPIQRCPDISQAKRTARLATAHQSARRPAAGDRLLRFAAVRARRHLDRGAGRGLSPTGASPEGNPRRRQTADAAGIGRASARSRQGGPRASSARRRRKASRRAGRRRAARPTDRRR